MRNLTHGSKRMVFYQILLYKLKFFDEGPDGSNQSCICRLKLWKSRCINNDSTFRKIQNKKNMTQGTRPPIFQKNTPVLLDGFLFRPKWRSWGSYTRRKMIWTWEDTKNICAFWYSLNLGIRERHVPVEVIPK